MGEARWNNDTANSQCQQTGSGLSNSDVEELFGSTKATKEKRHSHDEEKIGENTSNQGCLYNDKLIFRESNNGNNKFNRISISVSRCN